MGIPALAVSCIGDMKFGRRYRVVRQHIRSCVSSSWQSVSRSIVAPASEMSINDKLLDVLQRMEDIAAEIRQQELKREQSHRAAQMKRGEQRMVGTVPGCAEVTGLMSHIRSVPGKRVPCRLLGQAFVIPENN